MKQLFLALLLISLTSCREPDPPGVGQRIPNQYVTVTNWYVAKYSKVKFVYYLRLPNGESLPIYGDNGLTGYYYRKYDLHPGQRVPCAVTLYAQGGEVSVGDINFSAYETK